MLIDARVMMQEYSAALQQILPATYSSTSHHVKWERAFQAALESCNRSLSLDTPNPSEVEAAFQGAWQQAPAAAAPQDVMAGHRALHLAAQHSSAAVIAAQEESGRLAEESSLLSLDSRKQQASMLVDLKAAQPSNASCALQAFFKTVEDQLRAHEVHRGSEQRLQELAAGLIAVAEAAQECGHLMPQPNAPDAPEMPLELLAAEASAAAQAQAEFQIAVAPTLAACGAAGPTAAMLHDAAPVNQCRRDVEGLLLAAASHSAQLMSNDPAAETDSDAALLQKDASACVDSFNALLRPDQAAGVTSPIMPALRMLHGILQSLRWPAKQASCSDPIHKAALFSIHLGLRCWQNWQF